MCGQVAYLHVVDCGNGGPTSIGCRTNVKVYGLTSTQIKILIRGTITRPHNRVIRVGTKNTPSYHGPPDHFQHPSLSVGFLNFMTHFILITKIITLSRKFDKWRSICFTSAPFPNATALFIDL